MRQYASKGILVDTNILLLFFVGMLSKQRIVRFKRTEQFTADDYDLLVDTLNRFESIVTTPNVLTEVNSLINQLGEPDRSVCYRIFANKVKTLQEFYLPSQDVVSSDWGFLRYGLTDKGISTLARSQYLVLTDDLRLSAYLYGQGIDVINFNNLRFSQLGIQTSNS